MDFFSGIFELFRADLVLVCAGGMAAGAVAYYFVSGGMTQDRLKARIHDLEQELTRYKADISEHFVQSAHSANQLARTCREVCAQLAESAEKLCEDESVRGQIKEICAATTTLPEPGVGAGEDTPPSVPLPPRDYPCRPGEDEPSLPEGSRPALH